MHFRYEGEVILHPHVVEQDVTKGVSSHLAFGWVNDISGFVHIDHTNKLFQSHRYLIVGVPLGNIDLSFGLMRLGVDVGNLTQMRVAAPQLLHTPLLFRVLHQCLHLFGVLRGDL